MAALGMRAVQVYHHASQKAQADAAVAQARKFLESHTPRATEGRSYQLLGLRWAGAPRATLQNLARELKGTQRPDGGWNSVNGRDSDAYSTAQALVALHDGGGVAIIDASYQRGVEFLLKTQAGDGTRGGPAGIPLAQGPGRRPPQRLAGRAGPAGPRELQDRRGLQLHRLQRRPDPARLPLQGLVPQHDRVLLRRIAIRGVPAQGRRQRR